MGGLRKRTPAAVVAVRYLCEQQGAIAVHVPLVCFSEPWQAIPVFPCIRAGGTRFEEPSENAPSTAIWAAAYAGDMPMCCQGAQCVVWLCRQHVLPQLAWVSPCVNCLNKGGYPCVVCMETRIQ